MTRSLLSPDHLRPVRPVDRRTSVAALAAALAAAEPRWLPLVEYRAESRWSAPLPRDAAADVLDPSLHDDLARAQVWLLSWLPGQGTALHDHGGSAGAGAHRHRGGRRRLVRAPAARGPRLRRRGRRRRRTRSECGR